MQTTWGEFEFVAFESVLDGSRHLAFVRGDVAAADAPARAGAQRVPHRRRVRLRVLPVRATLDAAMRRIADEGTGVLVYLRGHEGRGLGVAHTLAGAGVVDPAIDPATPQDSREYGVGAQILADLGVTRDAADDQQPGPLRRARGLRAGDRRARRARPLAAPGATG